MEHDLEKRAGLIENIITNQIEDEKSPLMVIELPCGWLSQVGEVYKEAEVREICGEEEDILASQTIPAVRKLSLLLARCTTRLGPETNRAAIEEMIKDLPVGDRLYLLFAIRRVTLGDVYPFEQKCPDCEAINVFTIDLNTLEKKGMPDPTKRVFDVKLPSGKAARFHVMTGREEEKLSNVPRKSMDTVSLALLARLDLIEGKSPKLEDVKKLSMRDRNYLRDQFDEVEGGMETTVDVSCPACGHEFQRELSIDKGFFTPSALRKHSKPISSS